MDPDSGDEPTGSSIGALLEVVLDAETKARLAADYERATAAFGAAFTQAQVFELSTRMVEPALAAPVGDDGESQRSVRAGLRRPLGKAIEKIGPAANGRVAIPEGFLDRLDEARRRRNRLAHGYAIRLFRAVVANRVDEVIADLEGDDALFVSVSEEMRRVAFDHALGARDFDPEAFDVGAAGLLHAAIMDPSLFDDVEELEDFDIVIDRMKNRLGAER